MTTAIEQLNAAARLIGVLAEGEVLSADAAQDLLSAFNQMLDSWSTERLAVYTTQDQTFTWPANTISRTLGPTGDFVGNRPVALDDSTYFVDPQSGVSYGITIINEQQYNGIALKTVTSTFPQVMSINPDVPNLGMDLYPVPTIDLQWHFISVTELAQAASTSTTLTFPPGYMRAFKYNLACEIAPEFGVEPSKTVQRIAMVSKRNLKRQNNPLDLMSMPAGIMGQQARFNIYAGNY